jgi:hypothetical protein
MTHYLVKRVDTDGATFIDLYDNPEKVLSDIRACMNTLGVIELTITIVEVTS